MPSRKTLKEQYYAYAKDIYDKQEEPDKTVLIQAALLFASSWYIELEDRDGKTASLDQREYKRVLTCASSSSRNGPLDRYSSRTSSLDGPPPGE